MERRKRRQRRPRRKVWTQKTVDRFKAEAERVERPDP